MSTFITTLGGKRCTAIPRSNGGNSGGNNASQNSVGVTTSTPPPASTTSVVAAPASTTAAPPPAAAAPAVDTTTSESSSISTPPPATTTPPPTQTTPAAETTTPSPAAASTTAGSSTSTTPEPPAVVTPPPALPTIPTPADPTSSSSTTSSSSSSSVVSKATVVAQSEVRPSETSTDSPIETTTLSSAIPSRTLGSEAASPSASSTAAISSAPKSSAAPVVGGIMGGIALIGIFFFLWWRYKKRRARDSLLTPLTPQSGQEPIEKYEIDNESLGPTARREIWKAQAGGVFGRLRAGFEGTSSTIRARFDRDTPSINLNRGNSQFIQAIPQHSRSNSSATSAGQESQLTQREKFSEWWTRFTEDVNFNWRLRNLVGKNKNPVDPFTAARSMNEKEIRNRQTNPDFSNFLSMKDSELREAAERRRNSLSASQSGLGSLGIDFSTPRDDDPFADPVAGSRKPTIPNLASQGETLTLNPFADPPSSTVPAPKATAGISQPANYVADIRRSRGQSISASTAAPASRLPSALPNSRYPSTVPGSRYPSTIRTNTSHDSFRSSIFSMNPRKKAGRSDPFDLETLQLARPNLDAYPTQTAFASRNSGLSRITQSPTSSVGGAAGSDRVLSGAADGPAPRVVSVQAGNGRVVSEAGTYSSKYSSGASQLMSEWGDPGPDLGPGSGALSRATGSQRAVLDEDPWDLERKPSKSSGKSVGKAM